MGDQAFTLGYIDRITNLFYIAFRTYKCGCVSNNTIENGA